MTIYPAENVIQEAAAEFGLRLESIASRLYTIKPCWTLVTLSVDPSLEGRPSYRVNVHRRYNRAKRWKKVYKGPSLKTALRKASEWRNC